MNHFHHQSKQELIKFRGICWTFASKLEPGDYTLPFEFHLPADIPASIIFEDTDHLNKPMAKVKYSITSILNLNNNKSILKYKQWLIVHEPPVEFVEGRIMTSSVPLRTCCCNDQGTGTI